MAFKATYVDASTFTVTEDRTGEFVAGRRILADCGADGKFKSDVTSSSYDSGANETTVNIYDSVLTSNLSDVWYGAVSAGADGSLPLHDHSGRDQGGKLDIGADLPTKDFGELNNNITLDLSQYRFIQVSLAAEITIDVTGLFADNRALAYLAIEKGAVYRPSFTCEGVERNFIFEKNWPGFTFSENGWNISDATEASSCNLPSGNNKGTLVGDSGNKLFRGYQDGNPGPSVIDRYDLSSAWNVCSASSPDVSLQVFDDGRLMCFSMKDDGTKLYTCDGGSIFQWSLSTAWDLSTASDDGISASPLTDGSMTCITFANNGELIFIATNNGVIQKHTLGTAWDITTISSADESISFSITNWLGIDISPDGSFIFAFTDQDSERVKKLKMSSAWSLGTASLVETFHSYIGDRTYSDAGCFVQLSPDGKIMILSDNSNLGNYDVPGSDFWDVISIIQLSSNIVASGMEKRGIPV